MKSVINMKRFWFMAILIMMGFGLYGCTKNDPDSNKETPDTEKQYFIVTYVDYNGPQTGTTVKQVEGGKFLSKPTVSGYVLEGAYSDAEYTIPFDWSLSIQKDTTIYLKWNLISKTEVMDAYLDHLITSTTGYIPYWNKESFKGRWNYIDGVFLNSIVNLYYDTLSTNPTKAESYKTFFINYIDYYIDEDGKFINPQTKEPGYASGELDSICESKILFDAYDFTQDVRYLKAIDNTYKELMKQSRVMNSNQNFSHKETYKNQIWLDGMYMYAPFYARYAKTNSVNAIFEEICGQYQFIRENMFDETKKLYYHGYDSTKTIFWADKEKGVSSSFWLRSIGWYLVSLVDILEYFPEGEEKESLTTLLQEAVEGIMQYQDKETKMFYQIVDLGKTEIEVSGSMLEALKNKKYEAYYDSKVKIANYLESSGSSMISYVLLKGSRLGYLDSSYSDSGKEIFEGIYNHSFKNNVLNDICITAGLGPATNPYRDGSHEYYLAEPVGSDDAKGVGPFLMAYLETIK